VQFTFIPQGANVWYMWSDVSQLLQAENKRRKYHQQTLKWLSDLLQSKYWTQSNFNWLKSLSLPLDGGSGEAVSYQKKKIVIMGLTIWLKTCFILLFCNCYKRIDLYQGWFILSQNLEIHLCQISGSIKTCISINDWQNIHALKG